LIELIEGCDDDELDEMDEIITPLAISYCEERKDETG